MEPKKASIASPKRTIEYIQMIERGEQVLHACYGDGEWACILGHTGANSQGGKYNPDLAEALEKTIAVPRFSYWGTNPGIQLLSSVQAWCRDRGLPWFSIKDGQVATIWGTSDVPIRWVCKEAFANDNCQGRLGPFIRFIRDRQVMVVGPEHLYRATPFAPVCFIQVPLPGAWNSHDRTTAAILKNVEKEGIDLILFSSGMSTNVVLWEIADSIGPNVSALDCGAIWDPFVGVKSRSAYKKPEFIEVVRQNLMVAGGW